MPSYNIQKIKRLENLVVKHNRRMRKVLRRDLESRAHQVFSDLNNGETTFQQDIKRVREPVDNVFEVHQFDTVRSSVSDGIQEVTPENELALWQLFPDNSCPIITLDEYSPKLAKKRDKIAEKALKDIRKRLSFSLPGLRNLLLTDYLSNLRAGFRDLSSDWIEGEGSIKDVLDMLSLTLGRTDHESKRIFRTETTNYFNETRADYFKENTGMDFMQIFALTDGRISKICESRHLWVFPIAEATQRKKMPAFHPHCYSNDTEVYTDKGWQLFKDVNVGQKALSLNPDTHGMEWVPIIDKQVLHYDGEMIHMTNNQGSLDLMVTPDHTMFYYKNRTKGKEPVFETTDTFLNNSSNNWLSVSANWSGKNIEYVDVCGLKMKAKDFCRFMGFYLSDGSVRYGSLNVDYAQISQQDGQDIMFEEMKNFGFKNVTKTKEKIHVYDGRVGKYCKQFGKSPVRFVPDIIKQMTPDLIRCFLDAFNQCDGYIQPPKSFKNAKFKPLKRYFTTSQRMSDDLTELLLKVGKSASVKIRKLKGKEHCFKNGVYTLNHDLMVISELNSQYRKAQVVNRIPYNNLVYDLSLSNFHTLLVRRNGRMVWGSNCRTIQRPLTSRLASHRSMIKKGLAMDESRFVPLPTGWI